MPCYSPLGLQGLLVLLLFCSAVGRFGLCSLWADGPGCWGEPVVVGLAVIGIVDVVVFGG